MHQGTERRACISHRHTHHGFQRIDLRLEARGALGRAAVGWRRRDLRLVVKEVVEELIEHVVEEVVESSPSSAAAPS